MNELKEIYRLARWCFETVWIGNAAILRFVGKAFRLPLALQHRRHCPRGHWTPVFGVYQCKCGSLHEGWAFDRCHVCRHSAGWTPCVKCGLAIKNPWR